ncbi:hypothetical protein CR513_51783, partial [Mucuna pruriens]
MGCGKSKHDVASGNVLQRKKSTLENETEAKNTNNHNLENVSSKVQVEQKGSESVTERGVEDNVSVKEEDIKDPNISTSEGEEKGLKAEEVCRVHKS